MGQVERAHEWTFDPVRRVGAGGAAARETVVGQRAVGRVEEGVVGDADRPVRQRRDSGHERGHAFRRPADPDRLAPGPAAIERGRDDDPVDAPAIEPRVLLGEVERAGRAAERHGHQRPGADGPVAARRPHAGPLHRQRELGRRPGQPAVA